MFKKKINCYLKNKNGFTLIELILYIALTSIVLVGAISFAWNMIYLREKSVIQKISAQNGSLILSDIQNTLQTAKNAQILNINTLSTTQLNGNTITYTLSGQNINKSINGGVAFPINSNQVGIATLEFTDTSANQQSQSINTHLVIAGLSASPQFSTELELSQANELRGWFNQAREVTVDLSQTNLSGNSFIIQNIILKNIATTNNTLAAIGVSWTGANNINNISSGTNIWSGTASSGTTIDIIDEVLLPNVNVAFSFSFSGSMSNIPVDLTFYFADGSFAKAKITLISAVASPTPTPTSPPSPTATPTIAPPTPTPTLAPPTSCLQVCQQNNYSTSACRSNNASCNANGETRVAAGDIFCNGGASADTCCCKP
ncbi:MAG: hypothetical protein AUK08_03255 [Candidatus Pacebacteria bacterium CG2_30_36_39]|nr:MAG: hypothetical protein AUK08_03255 [Candidatus Pacebacteria bacterium CG2_30_36_39]